MSERVFYASEPDMAAAVTRARDTFGLFWRELSWEYRRIVPAFDLACAKIAFEQDGKIEHMWVGDVGFDGAAVTGTLMNEPNELTDVHQGDSITASFADRLGDWMLVQDGKVLGAFTVNAMRAAMDDDDRREHDEAWGLDFGDPDQIVLPASGDDHPMALNMGSSLEEFLTENPRELTAADENGLTLLHREALAGNANIVAILLARGAAVNARTANGRTPLSLARVLGWHKVEELLLAAGATT